MTLFTRTSPPPNLDDGDRYPRHERAADRAAGKRAARTWMPRDPRDPEPPPAVMSICAEVLVLMLNEYQGHRAEATEIARRRADARVQLDHAQFAVEQVAEAGRPGPSPDEATAETTAGHDDIVDADVVAPAAEFDFDQTRDELLRHEAEADRAERAASHRRQLADARSAFEQLEVRYTAAEEDYRLRVAAHVANGALRIRTVTGEVRARHPLRSQLAALDQRCLAELKNTVAQLPQLVPPALLDHGPQRLDGEV